MSIIHYVRQKKKVIGVFSSLIAVTFVFVAALSNVFASVPAYYLGTTSIELDGEHDGTVTVTLRSPIADSVYSIEGNFLTASYGEDPEHPLYYLTSLTAPDGVTPSSNTIVDGRIFWQDASFVNPIAVEADGILWTATYTVDKNTPAGQYGVYLDGTSISSATQNYDTGYAGQIYSTFNVTRNDEPGIKPDQVVTFRDEDGNPIEEITKYYGDGDFIITKEVTTGDGEITDYHPDDDGTGTIAHTVPGGDYVGVGEPGDVEICAWVEETANYAETKACYTVHVLKRLISIDTVTVESKVFDGTADATVTSVSFNNGMLNRSDYEATAEFEDANVGEYKSVTVTVELVGDALNHYTLDEPTHDTTAQITPFILTEDNITLVNGYTYGYTGEEIEPEIRVEANVHGGTTTLVEDQDYEVYYTNNIDASDHAYVVVLGKGNYDTPESISVLVLFTIEPRGINNDNLIMPTEVIEGHLVSKSDIRLNYDGQDLVQCDTYDDTDCDFFVTLTGNNTGTLGEIIHVAVEGRNNYTGVAAGDIEIVEKLPQEVTFEGLDDLEVYKEYGDENFQVVATTNGGGNISYSSSNTNVATVNSETGEVTVVDLGETYITATATAEGDYAEGSASYLLHVSKKHIKVESVWVQDKVYDGTTLAYAAGATLDYDGLVEGVDYHIGEVYFPSSNVGDYEDITVPVILEDSTLERYTFWDGCGPKECGIGGTASIAPFELSVSNTGAELNQNDFVYSGEAIEPSATVRVDFNGDTTYDAILSYGTDYIIDYENNVNAGLATATISGQGNYSGTLPELGFQIRSYLVQDVEVTIPAQTFTGEALTPVVTVTGVVNGERITIDPENYNLDDAEYIYAGDYMVEVNTNMDANYHVETTAGTFTINKAESGNPPEMEAGLKIEAGETLADLGERTTGFSWNDSTTTVAEGEGNYPATYYKDGDNKDYLASNVSVPVYGLKRVDVEVEESNGGVVTGADDTALEGDDITLTFTPDDGFELESVTVNGEDRSNDVSNGQLIVTVGTDGLNIEVSFRRVYEVVEGNGQKHIRGVDGAVVFEIDADYDLFETGGEVYLDDELVAGDNYDSWNGSTIISLNADYVDSLALGEHKLVVLFNDNGIARATLQIADPEIDGGDDGSEGGSESNPATADTGVFTSASGTAVTTSVSVAVVVALFGVAFGVVKKNKKA